MPYAVLADVQEYTTGRPTYTASTRPTASQVGEYLENTAAELDGILRARGYTVPVATTATSAYRLMRRGNALGAAADVEVAAPLPHTSAEYARKLYDDFKAMLREGDIELDASKDTTQSRPRINASASPFISLDTEW